MRRLKEIAGERNASESIGDRVPARRAAKASLRSETRPQAPITLASLKQDPESAGSVPAACIPALVAELASEQAALCAVQGVLTARLLMEAPADHKIGASDDRLMTADEVAAVLGVPKRWVQRRARKLPFSRFISKHAVRYSESGLKRWLEHRRNAAA